MEQCIPKGKVTLNPIIDWEDDDVWEYLNEWVKVPHCSLYDEGFRRLGCIGCPMSGREGMVRDFARWPKYKDLYIKAFDKMIENHPGEIRIATGENAEGGGYNSSTRGPVGVPLVDGRSKGLLMYEHWLAWTGKVGDVEQWKKENGIR